MPSNKLFLSIAGVLVLLLFLFQIYSPQQVTSLEQVQNNFSSTSSNELNENMPNGLEFAGEGYNILIGNPMNANTFDPGVRKQIYDFTYTQHKKTPDGLHDIPDQVQAEKIDYCVFQSKYSEYTGMQGYKSQVSENVNNGASFLGLVSFSVNSEYKQNSQSFSAQRQVQFSIYGSCEAYRLTVDTFKVPTLRPDFITAVTESFQKNDWEIFLQEYGTHFISLAKVGGRFSLLQTLNANAYANLESQDYKFEVGARAAYKRITGTGGNLNDQEKFQASIFQQNTRQTNLYILGESPPKSDNVDEWRVKVRENPTAISYEIIPIYQLITADNFPTLSKEQIKNSLQGGIDKFCKDKGCSEPQKDPNFPPKPNVEIVRTQLYGHNDGGSDKADQEVKIANMHVCRVQMRCGSDIDNIKITICDQVGNVIELGGIGADGGSPKVDMNFFWDEKEYINGFKGKFNVYLQTFQFVTTSGKLVPEQSCTGYFKGGDFEGRTEGPLVGIFGKSGARIDKIGFYGSRVTYPQNEIQSVDGESELEIDQ